MGGPQLTTFLISFASFINMLHETRERWQDATPPPPPLDIKGHTDAVRSAAVFPDGLRIVTASFDKTAKIWDAASGMEIFTLEGHTDGLLSAAVVRNGTAVITAGVDQKIILHDRLG